MKKELDEKHREKLRNFRPMSRQRFIAFLYWLEVRRFFTYTIPVGYICWMWKLLP